VVLSLARTGESLWACIKEGADLRDLWCMLAREGGGMITDCPGSRVSGEVVRYTDSGGGGSFGDPTPGGVGSGESRFPPFCFVFVLFSFLCVFVCFCFTFVLFLVFLVLIFIFLGGGGSFGAALLCW